jgi:hypothetical protein
MILPSRSGDHADSNRRHHRTAGGIAAVVLDPAPMREQDPPRFRSL